MEKEIFFEGIGKIKVRTSAHSRFLRLQVDIKEGVVATIPSGISEKTMINFLQNKRAWIEKSLNHQEKIRCQLTVFTHNCSYRTRMHTMHLQTHERNTIKSVVAANKIMVWYPQHADVTDERIQRVIRRAVLEAWRVEAKNILPKRVTELAHQFNFRYASLTIKNARTRWGSCSSQNNINLNLQLMRLPDKLIDYVILHELNHTRFRHHQSTYWAALEQILPGARNLDKSLNSYHLEYW